MKTATSTYLFCQAQGPACVYEVIGHPSFFLPLITPPSLCALTSFWAFIGILQGQLCGPLQVFGHPARL